MEDHEITELIYNRDERGLAAAREKYLRYITAIASGILRDESDAEECAEDVLLGLWDSIPPNQPERLSAYAAKLTRRIALNYAEKRKTQKRGGGDVPAVLDELEDVIASPQNVEEEVEASELAGIIDSFLRALPEEERNIFLCRYWYFDSVAEICERFGFGASKIKMTLSRTRKKLRNTLREKGYMI